MAECKPLIHLELMAARSQRGRVLSSLILMAAFLVAGVLATGAGRTSASAAATLWLAFTATIVHWARGAFDQDIHAGVLDTWQTSGQTFALEVLVVVRWVYQWLWHGIPLALAAVAGGATLGLVQSADVAGILCAGMLAAVWACMGIALLASALTTQHTSALLPVIALPLLAPIVIFGSALAQPQHAASALAGLAGMAVLVTCLVPFATAAALRIASEHA